MTQLIKSADTIPQYSEAQIAAAAEFGMDVSDYVEMMGESELTKTILPLWRFNGQDGNYVNKASKPYNPDQHPASLTGIILAVSYSQIWLRPYNEPNKYSQSWICFAGDKRQPPKVHPELLPEEKEMVEAAGAGRACIGCQMAQWTGDRGEVAPICSSGVRMFFLTESNEPILLSFGGASARQLDRFLGSSFKNSRKPWSAHVVHFGRTRKTEPGKNYWEATFTLGDSVSKSAMPGLMEIRRQYVEHYERAREQTIEDDFDSPYQAPEAPESDSSVLSFDADGNPVFQ